jgi:hypothetical protein
MDLIGLCSNSFLYPLYIMIDKNLIVLWREAWLKPLYHPDFGSDFCKLCERRFDDLDFVTSCEFCETGIIHKNCADKHILNNHKNEILKKSNYNKIDICTIIVSILTSKIMHSSHFCSLIIYLDYLI